MKKHAPEIIITGGACAGKSTAIEHVRAQLQKKGYHPLIVREVATDFIEMGIPLGKLGYPANRFQREIILEYVARRERAQNFAKLLSPHRPVIIYDRGVMDGQAFMSSPELFNAYLEDLGISRYEASWSYDCVIHMESVAKIGKRPYENLSGNNPSRWSTYEDALEEDDKLLQAYVDHHHLRVVPAYSYTDLDWRLNEVMRHVEHALQPNEIERKYLVRCGYHARKAITEGTSARIHIDQNYRDGRRWTRADINGSSSYLYTIKKGDGVCRHEVDEWLTAEQYQTAINTFGPFNTLSKIRTRFIWHSRLYELDYFPGKRLHILEVELTDPKEHVRIPDFLYVEKEVTDDPAYRSANLAK